MTSEEELKSPAQTQRIHRCSPNPQDSRRRLIRSIWTSVHHLCHWLANSSDWNMWSVESSPPLPACRLQLSGGMLEGQLIRWFAWHRLVSRWMTLKRKPRDRLWEMIVKTKAKTPPTWISSYSLLSPVLIEFFGQQRERSRPNGSWNSTSERNEWLNSVGVEMICHLETTC